LDSIPDLKPIAVSASPSRPNSGSAHPAPIKRELPKRKPHAPEARKTSPTVAAPPKKPPRSVVSPPKATPQVEKPTELAGEKPTTEKPVVEKAVVPPETEAQAPRPFPEMMDSPEPSLSPESPPTESASEELPEPRPPSAPVTEKRKTEYKQVETQLHSIFSDEEEVGEEAPAPASVPDPEPSTEGPAPGSGDYQKIETALADIFNEDGDVDSPPPFVPSSRTAEPESKKIGLVGVKSSPDTKTIRGLGAAKEEETPPPVKGQDLPDFVSRVMRELDNRITGDGDLTDTAEMEPDEEPLADTMEDSPEVRKKLSKKPDSEPHKDLEALKDLFSGDD
jgi:hypothetical protein